MGLDGGAGLGGPTGIGVSRGAHDRETQRLEHGAEHAAVTERERADGVAVVGVAQGEEGRAPLSPRLAQYWKAILRACSTATAPSRGEEEMGVVDRDGGGQGLGQLDHHRVAVAQHGGVGDLGRLLGEGPVELGHVVAERVDPEGRDRIEVAVARGVDQFAPLGPLDDQGGVVGVGRHLREAVPDDGGIPLDPGAGAVPGRGLGGWAWGWRLGLALGLGRRPDGPGGRLLTPRFWTLPDREVHCAKMGHGSHRCGRHHVRPLRHGGRSPR